MIRVENVTKRFGSQLVLDGVSMEIPDGQTTAIVGPSGVGKSVLLRIIMGILKPDSGNVYIGDDCISASLSEVSLNHIRRNLGVLFQGAALFDSLSVFDNVAFALVERAGLRISRRERSKRVWEILESLSLTRYANSFPEQISIGIRKRVGLARALITEPRFLLIDEPNTGLDPLDGQEVYDLIRECREKWHFTGVVISHELPEVFQVSDRIEMMLKGQVIARGSPSEFAALPDPAVQQFLKGLVHGPIRIQ